MSEFVLLNDSQSSYLIDNQTVIGDDESFDPMIGQPGNLLLFTILWILIAVVGILANTCVISVMLFSAKLTSATQYFIINLAISDILFLAICPTLVSINVHKLISFEQMPSLLAKLVCKADYFSSHLTVFITCLTLMSMTFDRYIVIMHPLKSLSFRTKSKAIVVNILIWIVSVLLSIPHGYYRVLERHDNASICMNSEDLEEITIFIDINLNQFNLLYTIIIAYIIPFITIVICYLIMINKLVNEKPVLLNDSHRHNHVKESKKRRRILFMIAFVTILFGVSWLPIHAFHVGLKFFPNSFPIYSEWLFTIKNIAHTLTYLNSMLNPFFYTMAGNNFRKQMFSRNIKNSNRLKYIRASKAASIGSNNINRVHKNSRELSSAIGRIEIECNNNPNDEQKHIIRFEFSGKKESCQL